MHAFSPSYVKDGASANEYSAILQHDERLLYINNEFVSLTSRITHSWLYDLLRHGYSKEITQQNLETLPMAHLADTNHAKWKSIVHKEFVRCFLCV